MPRNVIPLFRDFGKMLRPDEFIAVSAGPARKQGARYDNLVKTRILSWESILYRDSVDLQGEVRGTDLDGLRFTLRLPDSRKVPGRFRAEQEAIVLEALGEHTSRRLRVIGQGEYSTEDGSLQQISNVDRVEIVEPGPAVTHQVPIWQRLAAIGAAVPEEAWADIPADLATNVDLHLYRHKDGSD